MVGVGQRLLKIQVVEGALEEIGRAHLQEVGRRRQVKAHPVVVKQTGAMSIDVGADCLLQRVDERLSGSRTREGRVQEFG
ncbi:hypothetical protein ASF76_11450 [Microbacterium sp. Leaf151]|nr:hypothetical protein ASF76_11450 [Microbacterium sp. Leaf151]